MSATTDISRRFVLALDGLIDAMLANGLGGIEVVRLFNIRMRTYEALPPRIQSEIPTPWHLTPIPRSAH